VARAVVGLVLEEERAAGFVQRYTLDFRRLGVAGEAEHKAELLAAIERESLLLVAARIERTLPHAVGTRFSRQSEAEAVAGFRQAFLTFLGGSLAWDHAEREAFRRDLGMYVRLAAREGREMGPRRGQAPAAGAFVDRCAFLIDPSMMGQAREAAARYQAELESCADQAVGAAFRGFRPRRASAPRPSQPAKRVARRRPVSSRKPVRRAKPAKVRRPKRRHASALHRKTVTRKKPAPKRNSKPYREYPSRAKPKRRSRSSRTHRSRRGR
jgi:hypothetical protein